MKIVVCVKQVPDADASLSVNPEKTWIVETGINLEMNPYDRYALEEALKLKDVDSSHDVLAVAVGPERTSQVLKTCLATGADRAIHLKDPAFLDGDPWATATALAAALRPESPDLILCGMQSDDGNMSQTPQIMAEILNLPHASGVMKLETGAEGLEVERELEGDRREVLQLPLPAVVSVQTGINEPRYASIKGIMAAKRKEMKVLAPQDIGLSPEQVGHAGSKIEFFDLKVPPRETSCEILSGSTGEVAEELVRRIREKTGLI
ncbi:MAG: electron transfer flavoprotein subunit beta/FixA family protein [Acidobacteriota bacterium]